MNMQQSSGASPVDMAGVEPWIIGVAAGGGLLLLICLLVCIVCIVRRRRKYHSDRDESLDEPPAANLRPITSTYASPQPMQVVEYDMVPPETDLIDRAKSHSYTTLAPEAAPATAATEIKYDLNIPDDRYSAAPKY